MLYYNFNISDYMSHTLHLDPMEDLAYRRLIDWQYLHEKPIPLDIEYVSKAIRMRTHSECIATVLQEYFEQTEDGYISRRISHEIARYRERCEKASMSAQARWNKGSNANALRPQCEGNAKQINKETNKLRNKHKEVVDRKPKRTVIPYQKIVDSYHEHLPMLAHVKVLSEKRKTQIRRLWEQGHIDTLDDWVDFFKYCAQSKFLTGINNRGWKPNLEWLTKYENFVNIYEGKYHE